MWPGKKAFCHFLYVPEATRSRWKGYADWWLEKYRQDKISDLYQKPDDYG